MREQGLPRSAWYKSKKIIALGILVLLAIVTTLVLRGLGGEATGSVDNSANFDTVQAAPTPQPIKVTGQFIAFQYLDSFRVTPSQKPLSPQLENFNYVTKSSPFWQLAVGVTSLPSNNLADDGSYSGRLKNPGQYKQGQWPINGQTVAIFSDQINPYSKAAFVPHNGMVASVALTGSGNETQLDTILQNVLKSLEWKK